MGESGLDFANHQYLLLCIFLGIEHSAAQVSQKGLPFLRLYSISLHYHWALQKMVPGRGITPHRLWDNRFNQKPHFPHLWRAYQKCSQSCVTGSRKGLLGREYSQYTINMHKSQTDVKLKREVEIKNFFLFRLVYGAFISERDFGPFPHQVCSTLS